MGNLKISNRGIMAELKVPTPEYRFAVDRFVPPGGIPSLQGALTMKKFDTWMQAVFAPPKKGSSHSIWYAGNWWKWRTGIAGSLRVRPDGKRRYRKPTEEETRQMELAFKLLTKREKR